MSLITKSHVETDGRTLLFWEFFEFIMHTAKKLGSASGDEGLLSVMITNIVETMETLCAVAAEREVQLQSVTGKGE